MTPRSAWEAILRSNRWVATAVVTVLTVVLVGGVLVATTTVACSSTSKLGLKLAQCAGTRTAYNNALPTIIVPSPLPPAKGGYTPPVSSPATYYPPASTPASALPPYVPPGSSGVPPQDPFYPAASQAANGPVLNCTLPGYVGPPGSGGFYTFPGGAFTPDPRSAVAVPSPGVPQGPGYYGGAPYGMTYDRAHSRWLPVAAQLVAPDGNHYAFAAASGIYVVDAGTGTETELGEGQSWIVLRVFDDRVFAVVINSPGLWSLPFTGATSQVTTQGYWTAASARAAFGTETSAVPPGTTQTLLRLDLSTGKTSQWFSKTGASVQTIGFDAQGNPFVQAYYSNGSWEIWVALSATTSRIIANSFEGFIIQGGLVADSHGVWLPIYYQFGNTQALALYVQGSGIIIETAVGGQVAGGCV